MQLTQFGIESGLKDRLDRLKADQKESIIKLYGRKRRYVTNSDVIRFLLDKSDKANKGRRR